MSAPVSVLLKLALVALIWGGTFIAGRVASLALAPATAGLWRYVIATVALFIAAFALERGLPRLSARQWLGVTLLGAVGVAAYNLFFMYGLELTPAGRASLIVALNPAMTLVGAVWLMGERLTSSKVAGILVALVGVSIVIGQGDPRSLFAGAAGRGELLMFGCALSWAVFTLLGKRLMGGMTPLAMTTYASLTGTVLLFAAVLAIGAPVVPHPSPKVWIALAYLGVFGTAIAFVWFSDGIRVLGAPRAAVFINLVPVFAVTLGVLLLGETIDLAVIVGGVLVVAGVLLLNRTAAAPVAPVPT